MQEGPSQAKHACNICEEDRSGVSSVGQMC